jgi:hypothetical protein
LTRMKGDNVVSYLSIKEDHFIQQSGDIRDDNIYTGKVDKNGTLIINSKGLKKKPKEIDLREASIWVEQRPLDPNREKALTANYLAWSDDTRVENANFRVCIQSEKDLNIQNYVNTCL